jgi:hypothetical protein
MSKTDAGVRIDGEARAPDSCHLIAQFDQNNRNDGNKKGPPSPAFERRKRRLVRPTGSVMQKQEQQPDQSHDDAGESKVGGRDHQTSQVDRAAYSHDQITGHTELEMLTRTGNEFVSKIRYAMIQLASFPQI